MTTGSRPGRLAFRWIILLVVLAAGCADRGGEPGPAGRLRVGVLPDEDRREIEEHYRPLLDYLERTLDVRVELAASASYAELLAAFRREEIDVAYFGGFTFVAARTLSDAQALVSRDRDRRFSSYFIVSASSPARSIEDLRGERLAFGSRLSTSGHLMPRYFLLEDGIEPEEHFGSVQYTGSHDATAYRVRDGAADIGVANALIVDAMFRDGRLDAGDVRILTETPPYLDYVWATRRDMPAGQRDALREAFLALGDGTEEHRAVLDALDATVFIPIGSDQFDGIASVVDRLDLLEAWR